MHEINIIEIYQGQEETIKTLKKEFKSSYRKKQIQGSVYVTKLGFEKDNQSDKDNHGGPDQAVCVYPQSSYDFFKDFHNFELDPCSFGENITIDDVSDKDICIADQYACGEVIFEVSQPRGPCWKISEVLGLKKLTSLVVNDVKTGFYLRVLKEGKIDKNLTLKLIKRKYEKLTIEYVANCYLHSKKNQDNIKEIILCPELGERFRKGFEKKLL